MVRIPGKILGTTAVLALAAHAALVVPGFHEWNYGHTELGWLVFLPTLLILLLGRLGLAFLPPGPVGSHDLRELPLTAAASLVLGVWISRMLVALGAGPGALDGVLYLLLAALALVRWITLPGAMVPRHRVRGEPLARFDGLVALAGLAWVVYLLCTTTSLAAHLWFALALLLFHGLGTARRRRAGRYLVLGFVAALGAPPGAAGFVDELGPALPAAVALGGGAAFLIPWLRRADKRAGMLAAIGFGVPFLGGLDPLAFVGPVVLVGASHERQRRFALVSVCAVALLCAALGSIDPVAGARGRWLLADDLGQRALSPHFWGLAWPAVLLALLLGALAFPWRTEEWRPGTIDEPRREARALSALLALAGIALALPVSPWGEEEALVILFPLAALLAGLLLIPAERVPAG